MCERAPDPIKYRTMNLAKDEDAKLLCGDHRLRNVHIVDGTLQEFTVGGFKFLRKDYSFVVLTIDRPKKLRYFVEFKHPFHGIYRESFETQESADSWIALARSFFPALTNESFTQESKEVFV